LFQIIDEGGEEALIYDTLVTLVVIGAVVFGVLLGYALRQRLAEKKLESSENLSARIVDEAKERSRRLLGNLWRPNRGRIDCSSRKSRTRKRRVG
jgi:hypothetical protein